VRCASGSIVVVDDSHEGAVRPLLRGRVTEVALGADRWGASSASLASARELPEAAASTLRAMGRMTLSVEYLDPLTLLWAPLIDPWGLKINLAAGVDPGLALSVKSKQPLEVTITEAFVQSMVATYGILSRDMADAW
jgi:hypothetical protein